MLIVKKFGGSSVADRECIFRVAERCIEEYRKGNDVIVVLSAMGDTTDELIEKAKLITAEQMCIRDRIHNGESLDFFKAVRQKYFHILHH